MRFSKGKASKQYSPRGRICTYMSEVIMDILGLPESLTKLTADDSKQIKIFSGRANPLLSKEIAKELGLELGKIKIKPFSDGELYVQIQESVRGCEVFLIQPTNTPVNENLVELLIIIDALRRASAKTINVVMPYFGYARQDRKAAGREPITSKLVAKLIGEAGADRVLCLDLHSEQIIGFFDTLVDHVRAMPVLNDYIRRFIGLDNLVIVSPDVGGVSRARAYAKRLGDAPIAIVDKRRSYDEQNVIEVMNVIGDVEGKIAIIVDDLVDTAGTVCKAAELIRSKGALKVYACATHGVLSGPAYERIEASTIEEFIICDSIPLNPVWIQSKKMKQVSVAPFLAEAIRRIFTGDSVSGLFD
jgi:ribose-phosphate pyrophosphokinase